MREMMMLRDKLNIKNELDLNVFFSLAQSKNRDNLRMYVLLYLYCIKEKTMAECGEIFKISSTRVRQILTEGLRMFNCRYQRFFNQNYKIAGKTLRRINTKEVREYIKYWDKLIEDERAAK